MRYNFDQSETEEVEWLPLQQHPVFSAPDRDGAASTMPKNLLAWDGASHLYFWDSYKSCLHRVSVRLGDPDTTSILAASPSKVYFELQHHAPHVKKIIDDQYSRLRKAQQKILEVKRKQEKIEDRVEHAVRFHSELEERLQPWDTCRQHIRELYLKLNESSSLNLLIISVETGIMHVNMSSLLQFGQHTAFTTSLDAPEATPNGDWPACKQEIDGFRGVELDALRSSIKAVNARLKRYTHTPQSNRSNERRQLSVRRKSHAQENEMSLLKASLGKLSLVNSENAKKVKIVESTLKCREIGTS
ncbi:hypothetical protein RND71_021490 [Anisodus tanguticus]|uniref:Uncharacterized protein n=1 Tax=Anisodus tanguticus TaxID=243964 RepID=A0AAE1VCU6_9SOLA|nr:hypothetical protein RND71_021490 [Anisodus tanguticus]